MTSALQPFASASSRTVAGAEAAGIAALPPCATGNRPSRMRWPVTSGACAVNAPRHRPRLAHRPDVAHRQFAQAAATVAQHADRCVVGKYAGRDDRLDDAPRVRRRQAALRATRGVPDAPRLADHRAGCQQGTDGDGAPKCRRLAAALRMPGCTKADSAPDSGRSRPSKMWPSKPGPGSKTNRNQ